MNNMLVRALSGSVYVALIVACILLGPLSFIILMFAFTILGIYELESLLSRKAYINIPVRILDIAASLSILSIIFGLSEWGLIHVYDLVYGWTIVSGLALVLAYFYIPLRIIFAVVTNRPDQAKAFFYSIGTILYISIPMMLLTIIDINFVEGNKLILLTFILIWLNDTGAYLTGCTFGKHKLCERLSPKKTWEGFWGGLVITVIGAGLCGYLFFSSQPWLYAVFGAFVSIFATFGDLFESLIKRSLGVKDSGKLIPGHGGILDRIDSLLVVAYLLPALAFFI